MDTRASEGRSEGRAGRESGRQRLIVPPPGAGAAAAAGPLAPPASELAVIGDDRLRDFLLELAVERGYGVYCAEGALEALCVLGLERPGAVLVDLDMPTAAGLSFLDVFRRLRHEQILCAAVTARPRASLPDDIAVFHGAALGAIADALAAHFDPAGATRR